MPMPGRLASRTTTPMARGPDCRRCAGRSLRVPGSLRTLPRRSTTFSPSMGLTNEPLGVDLVEMPVLAALQGRGLSVVDGQQVFLEARRVKTPDEILLLTHACSMVDAAYEELYRALRRVSARTNVSAWSPRPCSISARSMSRASTPSPASAARRTRMSTPTASSAPATRRSSTSCTATTDTAPATTARSRSAVRHRRSATRTRSAATTSTRAIALVKPGVTTADICAVWPAASEFGFADEMAAFALQYGHGVGLSIWERPIFSRMISFDHPEVLEEGMVFALETYWPAADGWSASRSRRRSSSPPTVAR